MRNETLQKQSHNGFTYCKEEITDIVRDVHSDTHISEMEPVAQANERKRDDVVQDQLLEVLARLLQLQHQHNSLLRPVRRLQQVVGLEVRLVSAVWESLVHASGVEVPDGCARHDPESEWSENSKVHGRVCLLHEASLLSAALDPSADGKGQDQALHAELAGEGEDDGVESDESKVLLALAILRRVADVSWEGVGALMESRVRVGEVQRMVQRVVFSGRDVVCSEQDEKKQQRHGPGVLEGHALPSLEQTLCFAPFRSFLYIRVVSAYRCLKEVSVFIVRQHNIR